jgi:hypothetical protein
MRFYRRFRLRHIAVALIGILGVAGLVGCKRFHDMSPEEKREKFTAVAASRLSLTDQQKPALEAVVLEAVNLMESMRQSRDQDLAWVLDQVRGQELDQQAVLKLYADRKAKLDDAIPNIVARLAELHRTLDDEQKAKLAKFIEKHRDRHQR